MIMDREKLQTRLTEEMIETLSHSDLVDIAYEHMFNAYGMLTYEELIEETREHFPELLDEPNDYKRVE